MIEKHDLIHEFPEHKERIHDLKMNNSHFLKLFDEYHDVENEIKNIESHDVNTSDARFEEMKKQRLHLKDQLLTIINNQ